MLRKTYISHEAVQQVGLGFLSLENVKVINLIIIQKPTHNK